MKFHGLVGFWNGDKEVKPGVWIPDITERKYYGDVARNIRRFQSTEHQNDNLTINNQISILADLYAQENFHSIRYVVWNGVKWKVDSVDISYPRLILEIGEVYNEERPTSAT